MSNIIMQEIPSGGWTTNGIADLSEPSGDITITGEVRQYAFYGRTGLGRVVIPQNTKIAGHAFDGSSATSVFAPNAIFHSAVSAFASMTKCKTLVISSLDTTFLVMNSTGLEKVDLLGSTALGGSSLNGCSNLSVMVLRSTTVVPMSNTNALTNTPFASGKAGGTIYIPKSLYDHLGDGTANDYQAATNWSTYHGYGTITWAKIEGSIYENAYVDGTPIPLA